jgi:hypothetical protein
MADTENRTTNGAGKTRKRRWLLPLIFIPFFGALWVPSYNTLEPTLAGIPFFYWYQMAWIIISAAITTLVYLATEQEKE